jgi:acyl carrier protein
MSLNSNYNLILKKILKIKDASKVKLANTENTENWDSLTHLRLVSELEDFFKIIFKPNDILKFNSYNTGIKIIKKKLGKSA